MKTKQTALEWLESQQEIQNMINVYSCDAQLFLRMIFNEAISIEKEQIKDAYMICDDSGTLEESEVYAEQYYNRTYGK